MKKFGMFLLGVLTGGIVGTSLALLLTPESGENIRHQISDYSTSVRDDILQAAETRRKEMEQELARLRQKALP